MSIVLRDLAVGLTKLNFEDNFNSFTTTVSVAAVGDTSIRNELDEVPTGKIILRDGGSNNVVDGVTDWDRDFVYLQNLGGSAVTVTVMFFV